MQPQTTGLLIGGLIALILIFVRSRGAPRRLRVRWLWVAPLIFFTLTGFVLSQEPAPGILSLAGMAAALVLGGLFGWQRGRLTRLERDPTTGHVFAKSSAAGVVLIVAVLVCRLGLRAAVQSWPELAHVGRIGDWLLFFAVGLVSVSRIEMALRAARLHRGESGAASEPGLGHAESEPKTD